ncbi:hypothetical protein M0Q97_12100 [Candidatus Dojkabacteria bacterium]|jgi:hypothetical protein|nr:hypothetical protein [Candidatus Dojkabacteria bacterium]
MQKNINFTFGIITNGNNDDFIVKIIDDIKKQNIPNYEIIIVGGLNDFNNTVHISFNENEKINWITKKKNIITNLAKYDNIVYLHDYITLCENWYSGFLKYGDNFKICMTKIKNMDDTRFRDWTLWFGDKNFEESNNLYDEFNVGCIIKNNQFLLPYSVNLSKFMYFSGAYWIAKKDVMIEFPLNEKLSWCNGEDVEWSLRIRKKYDFFINEKSEVKLLKYKNRIFDEISKEYIEKITKIYNILYYNKNIKT